MEGRPPWVAVLLVGCLGWTSADLASAKPRCAGKKATVIGSKGRDVIRAPRRGPQVIVARGGRDRIITGSAHDTVCAGPGDDVVRTGGGKDRILTGGGDDFVDGPPGAHMGGFLSSP